MRIAIGAFALLFGGLHLAAGFTQFKSKDPAARGFAIAMVCGGIALVCAVVVHLIGSLPGGQDAINAAMGCLLICASAYGNGKRFGKLHPSHHIVRGIVAVLLVVGVLIW